MQIPGQPVPVLGWVQGCGDTRRDGHSKRAKNLERLYREQIYELGNLHESKKYKEHCEKSSLKTLQMR